MVSMRCMCTASRLPGVLRPSSTSASLGATPCFVVTIGRALCFNALHVDKDTSIIAFKGVQLCLACVAKDKDPYLHALLTDCKFFDVELNFNERALPLVMQHVCMQTEAALPADNSELMHLTINMIKDAFM